MERLALDCRLDELDRASDWLGARMADLGLPEDTVFAVRLCVEEALANVVTHGFEDEEGERPMSLGFQPRSDELLVVIEDQGSAFDPVSAEAPSLPAGIEDAAIGGRGIALIKAYASRLAYDRRDGLNVLTMGFARG